MSRHEIPAKDPAHKVVVSWDNDLEAFVGDVLGRHGHLFKTVSASTISDLRTRIRRYAEFDQDIWTKLKADKAAAMEAKS